MENWLKAKLLHPLIALLKQGSTPYTLAWSVTIGFVVGIFPIIGVTTVICLGLAIIFRLNLVAIQLVNYLVYPVQLLLLIPYFQLVSWFFGTENPFSSIDQIQRLFNQGFWEATYSLGWLLAEAIIIWGIIAIPIGFITYFTCLNVFKKYVKA
jgi:uncharacterized protein (DUF2062 family)